MATEDTVLTLLDKEELGEEEYEERNNLYNSLHEDVIQELKSAFKEGVLTSKELDTRALEAIKEIPPDDGVLVVKELRVSNLEHVTNKSAFLCSLIKSQRQKLKTRSGMYAENGDSNLKGPNEEKIQELLSRTGYSLDISPGQRKYGGPSPGWTEQTPPSGHELFCGKIPRDIYEDTLVPLFEKYGRLWDLRLMMDPVMGRNRGFCFVTYEHLQDAQAAVKALNNYEIRPGKLLKVNTSDPNVRLFIGNIPKTKSRDDILDEFKKSFDGIVDVIIYGSPDDAKVKNRGFAFVDFDCHRSASNARRRISIGRVVMWGLQIICDWAEPLDLDPSEEVMSKVKVLYVRNLKSEVTEDELRSLFEKFGAVERIKKVKSYAFVHFVERDAATEAMNNLHGTKILGVEIDVSLAKPLLKNRRERKAQLHNNGYYDGYEGLWNMGYPAYGNNFAGRGKTQRSYGGGDYYHNYYYDYPFNDYYDFDGYSFNYSYFSRNNQGRYQANGHSRNRGSYHYGDTRGSYYGSPNRRGASIKRSPNERSILS